MTPQELRDWRKQHQLSRKQLAEILGIHWMTVTAWEVGKQEPPAYLRYTLRGVEFDVLAPDAPPKKSRSKLKLLP